MLSEYKRKKIAREFLEEFFGKYGGALAETIDGKPVVIKVPFELHQHYGSIKDDIVRAFKVVNPPYVSSTGRCVITVGESYDEVEEIGKLIVDEEHWKAGCPEFEKYKGYWVMYD